MHAAGLMLFVVVGLTMGMLGGGGSMLAVPILVFVLGLDPHDAVPASLLIVALTSAFAVVPHARARCVRWRIGFVFGGAGMFGSFLAGLVARWIPGELLLVLLALMMGAIAIAMLRGGARTTEPACDPKAAPVCMTASDVRALLLRGLVVGSATGLVGAGGGFVIVPALVLLCRMPMQEAIGTSLVVIAMQGAAGFAGHASHAAVPWALVAQVSALAVAGSFVGASLARRVPQRRLRRAFGVLVLGIAAALLVQRFASLRTSRQDVRTAGRATTDLRGA